MQRPLQGQFELHILRQGKFLAEARSDHERRRGGDGRAHGGILFILRGNPRLCADKCGLGRGECCVFLFAGAGADFAFTIVKYANGMNTWGVNQISYQRNPTSRIVDFIKGEPKACAAHFSCRLDFVNVAADLGPGGEAGAVGGGDRLEGARQELLADLVFFGGDHGLQGNEKTRSASGGIGWRVLRLGSGVLRLRLALGHDSGNDKQNGRRCENPPAFHKPLQILVWRFQLEAKAGTPCSEYSKTWALRRVRLGFWARRRSGSGW